MQLVLSQVFAFIGVFNLSAAIFKAVAGSWHGVPILGLLGLTLLFLGFVLCPCTCKAR